MAAQARDSGRRRRFADAGIAEDIFPERQNRNSARYGFNPVGNGSRLAANADAINQGVFKGGAGVETGNSERPQNHTAAFRRSCRGFFLRGNRFTLGRNPDWEIFTLIMRWINYITTGLSLLMATGALFFLPAPASWIVAAIFAGIAAYAATTKGGKIAKSKFIVRLKGFAWTREDFCRGWLIINTARIPNRFGKRNGNKCDRRWKHLQQRLRCIINGLKFPKNLDSALKWADSASKTESPGFKMPCCFGWFFELVKFQENELTIYNCD